MLVGVFVCAIAHETAGAACIRLSLRPLFGGSWEFLANLGLIRPRDRDAVSAVIARSTLVRRSQPSGEGGCDDRVRRSSTSEGGSNPLLPGAATWIASPALAMTTLDGKCDGGHENN